MRKQAGFRVLWAVLLSLLSGVLIALALPPRESHWVGWIAFLPLLLASRLVDRSLLGALGGLLAAASCGCLVGGSWENAAQFGNLVAAFGGLGLVFAFVAGWSSFASRRVSVGLWAFLVPCAAVTAELLSWIAFSVTVAISQHQNAAALYAASYTGVWGVSFALWLVPSAAVALLTRPRSIAPAIAALILVLGLCGLSGIAERPGGPTIDAVAVQSGGVDNAAEVTRRHAGKADVVVWPELLSDPRRPVAYRAAEASQVYLAASFSEPRPGRKPYNSGYLISPSGREMGRFRKQHLFGRENYTCSRGEASPPIRCRGFTAGIAICFDTEFSDVTRRLVRKGADVILVPNSDPRVPSHLFNHLHSAVIPFRAAENGVPIAWAEHTYGSMVIDGDGRIVARVFGNEDTSAVGSVHPRDRLTFYTRTGDWLAYTCLAALPSALMMSKLRLWERRERTGRWVSS